MNEDFPVAEVGLARELGVSRTILRGMRGVDGVDWVSRGKTVRWTNAAADQARRTVEGCRAKVAEKTAVVDSVVNGEGDGKRSEDRDQKAGDGEEEFEVVRADFVNRRVVRAKRTNGELVMVRVRDARKFRRGMWLRAALEGSMWVLRGRHPRFVGKY